LLPELSQQPADIIVGKTLNDPFVGTNLARLLRDMAPERLLVTGWATDFCVDATVRSAVSHGHRVIAVSDAHTLNDRPHLDAPTVIRHHNWIWANLITRHPVRVAPTEQLLNES
jgi:nicotinamidase-related amidase